MPNILNPNMMHSIMQFLPMIIIFVLFWFLLIRPQQKKMKEHNEMLANLKVNEKVLTTGGIIGTIKHINDKTVDLQIAENTVVQLQRSSITQKVVVG
jgi:preprotein translocase subunit YajC